MKVERISGRTWRCLICIILILVLNIFSSQRLSCQIAGISSLRQTAMGAYSRGDFTQAYAGFSGLLKSYPGDPLYKYYSAVCLVRLGKDPVKAVNLLKTARESGSVARTVPSDAIYWQGRALQMCGEYEAAEECYNSFIQSAPRKSVRDLRVQDFIDQCSRRTGIIHNIDLSTDSLTAAKNKPESIHTERPDSSLVSASYDTVPAGYESVLTEAMKLHMKADSLYMISDSLKPELEKAAARDKNGIRTQIAEMETKAASYEKQADRKYSEAQDAMNATQFVHDTVPEAKKPVPADSVIKADSSHVDIGSANKPLITAEESKTLFQAEAPMVFSVFSVKAADQGSGVKVSIDPVVPPGLIYRIQLAVFRNAVAVSYFKGITPVYGFHVQGTDKTTYYAGLFRKSADAAKALIAVRQKGFKDAFVVSLFDGKPVSSERAAILEKTWGKKPFAAPAMAGIKTAADTIPPALSFRVELMRSPKAVKDEVLEDMKKVAANKALDNEILADGTIIYLVGYFITYESAAEYAGLLSRNGYRDAKVTAWLGKKQIPLDTAKKLVESLE